MIDVLPGSWAAGETKTFHVNGSYFEILECAYPVDVKLLDRNGAVRSDMRQAEASFYSEGLEFATIQITSVLAQDIRSFYGDGTAGTRRTAGVVSIIDGGKSRSLAGVAFLASAVCVNVAGQMGHIQLMNPGGSGKRIMLEALSFSSGAAGVVTGGYVAAPLTNVVAITGAYSKNSGGAASVAEMRNQSNVTSLVTTRSIGLFVQAGGNVILNFKEPIVLLPNSGFCISHLALNSDLTAIFEFFEETI